jgi:hypothetical protein
MEQFFLKDSKRQFSKIERRNWCDGNIREPHHTNKIIIKDPTYVDMKLFVNTNEFILYNSKLGIYDIQKTSFITGFICAHINLELSLKDERHHQPLLY